MKPPSTHRLVMLASAISLGPLALVSRAEPGASTAEAAAAAEHAQAVRIFNLAQPAGAARPAAAPADAAAQVLGLAAPATTARAVPAAPAAATVTAALPPLPAQAPPLPPAAPVATASEAAARVMGLPQGRQAPTLSPPAPSHQQRQPAAPPLAALAEAARAMALPVPTSITPPVTAQASSSTQQAQWILSLNGTDFGAVAPPRAYETAVNTALLHRLLAQPMRPAVRVAAAAEALQPQGRPAGAELPVPALAEPVAVAEMKPSPEPFSPAGTAPPQQASDDDTAAPEDPGLPQQHLEHPALPSALPPRIGHMAPARQTLSALVNDDVPAAAPPGEGQAPGAADIGAVAEGVPSTASPVVASAADLALDVVRDEGSWPEEGADVAAVEGAGDAVVHMAHSGEGADVAAVEEPVMQPSALPVLTEAVTALPQATEQVQAVAQEAPVLPVAEVALAPETTAGVVEATAASTPAPVPDPTTVAASAGPAPMTDQAENTPEPPRQGLFGGQVVAMLRDGALDTQRGGFIGDNGLKVSFGIERAVYINGNLVTTTSLNLSELGQLVNGKGAPANLPQQAGASVALIQNGAGNTVLSNLGPAAIGTVIQNTLNGQSIQTITTINATVNSMSVLRSMETMRHLRNSIVDSLRR